MKPQKLTEKDLERELSQSDKTVVVDFYADWCGPCKMLALVYDAVAQEFDDVLFGKVNIDEEPEAARRFGVQTIPTVILFENGLPQRTQKGFVRPTELRDFVMQARSSL